MNEKIWKGLNLLAWLLAALAWWVQDTAALKERVAVAETRIEQETQGYRIIQVELGRRLERVEDKLDRLLLQRR